MQLLTEKSHIFATPIMKHKGHIRIAFIGLGDRGRKALQLMLPVEGAVVTALCDLSTDNVCEAKALMATLPHTPDSPAMPRCADGPTAFMSACRAEDVDLVYICSDWASHTPIAVEAMRNGKHVAIEVPAATTMADIQLLMATSRQYHRECFMLENTCFEQQVREAVAAIRRGAIGAMVHAEGSYYHHLDERWNAWRLDINRQQRGDLYPTHALGPICMAMDIGHSDRLQTLVSMDSAALTGPLIYKEHMSTDAPDFQNGDHTTTLIRTALGRTILLKHDVMTRQPYERQLTFIGTEGRITLNDTGRPSHDEMTTAMNRHLIDSLLNGSPLDISVQDMATWCAAIPLSQDSISGGFVPVPYPDFYA